ncbi:hypothetical protein HYH03_000588 [Edaphochlamys debaryana]|uniref:Uncharacterized protein n=1 Tax=Edaphochlamys debaryana TaxID=47281 RepID=A0A835YGG0_9CHLO|nr:hypothetical protein HYH03_000588 [Edaphochlamys debaryana]|eukprot:KAG2502096.1 hypothetical protein HYH03_000588 [Edaphochlamys debaryana]
MTDGQTLGLALNGTAKWVAIGLLIGYLCGKIITAFLCYKGVRWWWLRRKARLAERRAGGTGGDAAAEPLLSGPDAEGGALGDGHEANGAYAGPLGAAEEAKVLVVVGVTPPEDAEGAEQGAGSDKEAGGNPPNAST